MILAQPVAGRCGPVASVMETRWIDQVSFHEETTLVVVSPLASFSAPRKVRRRHAWTYLGVAPLAQRPTLELTQGRVIPHAQTYLGVAPLAQRPTLELLHRAESVQLNI